MVNSMLLPLLVLPAAWSSPAHYQPVSGNLTVSSFQLYPENAAFDPQRGLVYLSALYNASVTAYDPFRNQVVNHIKIPGITGDGLHHAAGVQVDPFGYLSIVVSAGDAFNTAGQDISGDNFLVKYDLEKGCVAWKYNLTAITNGIYGGPQDLEHDVFGNTFVVGTFPKARVTFAPQEMTKIRTTAYQLPFSAVCDANITKITSFGRCGANITSASLYG